MAQRGAPAAVTPLEHRAFPVALSGVPIRQPQFASEEPEGSGEDDENEEEGEEEEE